MNASEIYGAVLQEMKKHIAGKTDVMELLVIALVADGHALLEGVPGTAKTTTTKTLASILQAEFKRIQCTGDLDLRDINGYTYMDEQDGKVKFKRGPVFTNILLADELNRAAPKTMNGLLETLEEKQVTTGTETMKIPPPFIAFATQNPLNIEGTVPIPKVLADRFLIRIEVKYPSMEEEQNMLRIKEREEKIEVKKVATTADIIQMQNDAKGIQMPDDVVKYITQIVGLSRTDIHVVMGGSPRADIAFMKCAKAKALIEGRKACTIDDVKWLARPVLSHRIAVRSTGGIGVNGIIDGLVASLEN